MSNASSSTNTVTGTVVFNDKGISEACIDDRIMEELTERLEGTVDFADPNVWVVSVANPSDTTKLWAQKNSAGQVTNLKYYNSLTGQWEDILSTAPDSNLLTVCPGIEALTITTDADGNRCISFDESLLLTVSSNSDNLLTRDETGGLIVRSDTVRDAAATLDATNWCNVLQKNSASSALSVDRGASFRKDVGVADPFVYGLLIDEDTDHVSSQTFDLSASITDVDWVNCPPSHAEVHAAVALKQAAGGPNGTWSAPTFEIRAGTPLQRVAMAFAVDVTHTHVCTFILYMCICIYIYTRTHTHRAST